MIQFRKTHKARVDAITVDRMMAEEFEYLGIEFERTARTRPFDFIPREPEEVNPKSSLSALCLSGGGIRSSSFCLGVIQALARHDQLESFIYLSTVSGGGYVGSWLSRWLTRAPNGLDTVKAALKEMSCLQREVLALRQGRQYLEADEESGFLLAYLKRLLINWIVILPIPIVILLAPLLYMSGYKFFAETNGVGFESILFIVTALAGIWVYSDAIVSIGLAGFRLAQLAHLLSLITYTIGLAYAGAYTNRLISIYGWPISLHIVIIAATSQVLGFLSLLAFHSIFKALRTKTVFGPRPPANVPAKLRE